MAELLSAGLSYNSDKTAVIAASTFSGTVNLADYESVKTFDGRSATNELIVIGNAQGNEIVGGSGSNSLYGAAGNDTLKGSSSRDQFWYMGDGNDVVRDFVVGSGETSDVVTLYNVGLNGIYRGNSNLYFVANGNSATLNLQTTSDDNDSIILYSADGTNIFGAKIAEEAKESLTYDSSKVVNYYQIFGTDNGTLKIEDDLHHEIWLDGSQGQHFRGIKNVDVEEGRGSNLIAGDAQSNIINGGAGSNSLWGGAGNADDTIYLNGSSNQVWYGYGEGNDVISYANEGDVFNLYNIKLEQISSAQINNENISVTMTNGNILTVQNSSNVTPTFQLANGEKYNYNRSAGTWQSVS